MLSWWPKVQRLMTWWPKEAEVTSEVVVKYLARNEQRIFDGLEDTIRRYEGNGFVKTAEGERVSLLFSDLASAKRFAAEANRLRLPARFSARSIKA